MTAKICNILTLGWFLFAIATVHASVPAKVPAEKNQQWQNSLQAAKGQTVYFYAWGGSTAVNEYLRWARVEIAKQFSIKLIHVKVSDPAEPVARLKAENGRPSAIDLLWVNGENFAYLKRQGYLLGDLWTDIPNTANLAVDHLPIRVDFGEPMDGLEVPWGIGQFNLIAESKIFSQPSIDHVKLLTLATKHPGTLTYPRPPEFHGTTFLKQLLVALTDSDSRLYTVATASAQQALLPILWTYLDRLHPKMWQPGQAFPHSAAEQMLLYQQQVLSMTVSFNPSQGQKEKANQRISQSSERRYFSHGAITNSHNLAIPKTARSKAAAKVVINFMLSEQAQRRKFNGAWGDPSVIASLLDAKSSLPTQPELHNSWHSAIEEAWQQRYGG